MRLPKYPKYKSSGVEWLGQVPKDWNTKRLKYSASINDEVLPETTDSAFEMSYVDISSVDSVRGIIATEAFSFDDAPSRARRVVRVGGTIVSTVRTYLRAIAQVRSPASNTIVSTGFAVVRPRRVDPAFLAYALRERGFVDAVVARSVGVSYPAVNASEVGTLPIPLPALDEQRAIADFLDRKTAKIDTLVAKKRTLIERLEEKRTALISRTVTRGLPPAVARAAGLDPYPRLKAAGNQFFGDVQSEWVVSRVWLERVAGNLEYQDGNHGEIHPKASDYVSDGVPFVMANHIVSGEVDLSSCNYIEPALAESLRIGFAAAGDVLLTHKGTIGRVGMVQPSHHDFLVLTPQVTYYRCLRRVEARFLFWFFQARAWQEQLGVAASLGTTRAYVGLLDQRFLALLLPPTDVQRAIGKYLDVEVKAIDLMITKVEAAIERLQEYRTALITAAVTGKIDVRKPVGDAIGVRH